MSMISAPPGATGVSEPMSDSPVAGVVAGTDSRATWPSWASAEARRIRAAARLEHFGPPQGWCRRGDLCLRGGLRCVVVPRVLTGNVRISQGLTTHGLTGRARPAHARHRIRPGVLARTSWLAPVG